MRKSILIILLVYLAIPVSAQNMKSVFVSMPDSITPLLTKVNREDCIDFLASGMKAEVTNRLGGKTEMKILTDDYAFVQVTPNSTLDMKLLPVNDSTKVICVVKTVCSSACNSAIKFYTSDWSEELDAGTFLRLPDPDAFFLPCDTLSEEGILTRKKADMHMMKASLSKDEASLTFVYTTPDYLNKADKEKLLLHVRKEPVVLRWKNQQFE